MDSDLGGNEKHRTTLILRVVAKMFRQHSDLFEQQAAVLERIASDPQSPSSWAVDEPSPESRQRQIVQENTTALAIKSYESMLQIQKRVDYLERLLARNGIKRIIRKPTSAIPKKRRITTHSKTGYYWFRHDHGPAIAEEYGVPTVTDNLVKHKLLKLWAAMNPNQRLPYWEKAQEEIERDAATKATANSSSTTNATIKRKAAKRMGAVDTAANKTAGLRRPTDDEETKSYGTNRDSASDVEADAEDSDAIRLKESATKDPDESSVEDIYDDDEPLIKSTESDGDSDDDKEDLLFVEV